MEQGVEVRSSGWHWLIVAVAGACIPFVMHYETSHSVNGALVSYRDWVAVGGGAIGIVFCGVAIVTARKDSKKLLMAVLVGALAGYQVARGFGLFAGVAQPATLTEPGEPAPPIQAEDPAKSPMACPTAAACLALGGELAAAKSPNAVIAFARGCDLDNPASCEKAADLLAEDNQHERAVKLYVKACDGGNGDACSQAGLFIGEGTGVTKDLARSAKLYARSCELESKHGCFNFGVSTLEGEGVPADKPKAHQLFAQACELGHATGCENQGYALYAGDGATQDRKAGMALLVKACEMADARCFNLGVIYDKGLTVKQDQAKARGLFQRACDNDVAKACHNLAVMLERGQGGAKDEVKARELYEAACTAGHGGACNNAGDMANRGAGGAKDVERANQLFDKACKAGIEIGCKNMKTP